MGQHPHEPSGFEPFAEHDASDIPPWPPARANILGSWYNYPQGNPNLTLEQDASAPVSPPWVLRTRFPKGFPAGRGPVGWGGWDERRGDAGYKSKLYLSIWLKIQGRDFENEKGGTKQGFLGVGNEKSGHAELFFWLDNGEARQRLQDRFKVIFKQQAIPQPNGWVVRNLGQNVNRAPQVVCGRWMQWEAVFELNDMGRSNGIFRMWVNGVQTHDYRDVTYITPKTPIGFNLYKWNPTWGGQVGVRTRDDFISIDHLYLSGIP